MNMCRKSEQDVLDCLDQVNRALKNRNIDLDDEDLIPLRRAFISIDASQNESLEIRKFLYEFGSLFAEVLKVASPDDRESERRLDKLELIIKILEGDKVIF